MVSAVQLRNLTMFACFILALVVLGCSPVKELPPDDEPGEADASVPQPDPVDTARYREFLRYYAPVILKQSSENQVRQGRDWVTNFDFDNDQNLSNNKENWEQLQGFVSGTAAPDWAIRPTLYGALIEFTLTDRSDVVLLYHVYHAKQAGSIHDWERVEIRLNGVGASPGGDEVLRYALVTEHSQHNVREGGSQDLNFLETESGKHLLIWQAPETETTPFHKGELHFVEEPWTTLEARLAANEPAQVDVNGGGQQSFHYAVVPQSDTSAVDTLSAEAITAANAAALSAGTAAIVTGNDVKRIVYELQDIADVFPTHWDGGLGGVHWTDPQRAVLLTEPLAAGLDSGAEVPAGLQTFLAGSRDSEDLTDERNGYASKHWFWGAYEIGGTSFYSDALNLGSPRSQRSVANEDPASLGVYFHQHDYFAHEGQRTLSGPDGEVGVWLAKGWHTKEAGGFDGRWVQLFPNDAQ